jgi:two-component system chemotaxis response regulator CheY
VAEILAVDDSNTMRRMLTHTLESAGHQVITACDGAEALDIAKGTSFDLVLTDVNMPRLDGISLVRELRELSAFKHTPILILTTESGSEKKAQGKAAGATGWLVKPFEPARLIATIQKVL